MHRGAKRKQQKRQQVYLEPLLLLLAIHILFAGYIH
jgi:hypothetical protein